MFPHRRAITVVLVRPGQNENHPPQASQDGSGERDHDPAAFEETLSMSEARERPYDNQANERCYVHKEPDGRKVRGPA